MASYSAKLYPEPDKRDAVKMKEFFTLKYKQRRFEQKAESESEDSESDDDKKKKKSKKEESKKKKSKKTKDSEEEESGDEGAAKKKKKHRQSSEEEEDPKKAGKVGKLMAPPGKKGAPTAKPLEIEAQAKPKNEQITAPLFELDSDQFNPHVKPA